MFDTPEFRRQTDELLILLYCSHGILDRDALSPRYDDLLKECQHAAHPRKIRTVLEARQSDGTQRAVVIFDRTGWLQAGLLSDGMRIPA